MPFSNATVVETAALSSRLRRIVLHIEDPDTLGITYAADSAVGVYFPGLDTGEGRNYSVRHHEDDRITLGRSYDADVNLLDDTVSSLHAELSWDRAARQFRDGLERVLS